MSAEGSTKAIIAALTANAGIAVAKFVGFAITGSSSMLAEGVHSVADSGNQALLLVGGKQAKRKADAKHQFGYGANRYFFAFVVALVLFLLGSVFAIYEGIHKLQEPEPLTTPIVAVIILVLAIGLESYSFRTALVESNKVRGDNSWWQFIRRSRNPELPVVLLEDIGALIGLMFALFGVSMTWVTGNGVFDAVGTLMIGVLLGIIAVILIIETRSLLIGEPAVPEEQTKIEQLLVDTGADAVITGVIHLRTQHLSPDDLLIAAKVAIAPGSSIQQIAVAIDTAEKRVRDGIPHSALMYLEPDVLGATLASEAVTRGQIGSP